MKEVKEDSYSVCNIFNQDRYRFMIHIAFAGCHSPACFRSTPI